MHTLMEPKTKGLNHEIPFSDPSLIVALLVHSNTSRLPDLTFPFVLIMSLNLCSHQTFLA